MECCTPRKAQIRCFSQGLEFLIGCATISYAKLITDFWLLHSRLLVCANQVWKLQRGGEILFGIGIQKYSFIMLSHCLTPELLPTIPM